MKTFFAFLIILCFTLPIAAQPDLDEQAIHGLMQTMADAWTDADGQRFASVFADQHDYIVWSGYYLKNIDRTANGNAHQGLFNSVYRNTRLHVAIDKIKFIREDIALVHVLGAVTPKDAPRPDDPQVLWTSLLEKADGAWRIISFHNLDLEVFQDEQVKAAAPVPPQVMYAGWYRGGDAGAKGSH